MKKSLLFSVAALSAAMTVSADEIVYDFDQIAPQFAIDVYLPAEPPTFGFGLSGNIDLIDKTGVPWVKWIEDAQSLQEKVDDVWTVDTSKAFDMETGELVDYADADLSHSFIVWGDKGVARVLIMPGWGNYDGEWGEKDYQAASEEDYIGTKNALAFNRNANSGCRQDTYFQIPAVQGPFSVDLYLGTAGGKYVADGIKCKIVPVVNGEAQEASYVGKPDGEYTYKRMYKFTYNYEGTDAPIMRFGCDNNELNIYHIVIKTGEAGVENVAVDAAAADAPIYNTLGIQVDENYKGLVIKGGKKYIQK